MSGAAPVVILLRPQLGENIGAAARAMKNFGLEELRLVAPRAGWPDPAALAMAAGAGDIVERARLCDGARHAVADLARVWAASARSRSLLKPVVTAAGAGVGMRETCAGGEPCGILFGPERAGLDNEELALADTVLRIPTAPGYASINLAQAVAVVAYEWCRHEAAVPVMGPRAARKKAATKGELEGFFDHLIAELDACGFLRNEEQRPAVIRNLRTLFQRAGPRAQEVRTLRGVIACLASGRRGPPERVGSRRP